MRKIDDKMIRKHIQCFDNDNIKDEQAIKYVFDLFPLNKKYDEVLMKILILDRFYSTNIWRNELHALADHIIGIKDLDRRLKEGDLEAVYLIGNTPKDIRNAYVFASKYCSFHNPEAYPIFDQYSRKALCRLNADDPFVEDLSSTGLEDYRYYCKSLDAMMEKYQLRYSYKEIDKFLWRYGKGCKEDQRCR